MSEKRFEATPQRLKKARQEGISGKSSILTQSLVVIGLVVSTIYAFNIIWVDLKKMLKCSCILEKMPLAEVSSQAYFLVIGVVGSCLMIASIIAITSEGMQVGFRVESKPVLPQFKRLSPFSQIKNIPQRFKDIFVKILPIIVILCCSYSYILKIINERSLILYFLNDTDKINYSSEVLLSVFGVSFISFLLASLVDIFLSRKKFKKNTMMSLEELKEEYKENEGNPEMKQARNQAHQELLYEEIVKRVKRSKVIVVAKEDEE